jgi:hypothetical protein
MKKNKKKIKGKIAKKLQEKYLFIFFKVHTTFLSLEFFNLG